MKRSKKALALVMACFLLIPALNMALAEGGERIPVSFFGRFTNAPIDQDDPIIAALEEATGLDITFYANPASNFVERLQIMLASGEYPDLITFPSHTSQVFIDAVANGVVVPLNEYLDSAPALVDAIYDVAWNAMKIHGDDQIWGVPQATAVRFDGYVVRKDWADKLGIEIPEDGQVTREAFEAILDAFTNGDPDGNGLNDTFGLTTASGSNGEIGVIAGNSFGLMGWQAYEDEAYPYMDLRYSRSNPAFKEALAWTAELWQAGYIDKNWTSNRGAELIKTRFKSNLAGMVADFSGYTFDFESELRQNWPEAECTYITGIKDADGQVKGAVSTNGYYYLNAITSAAAGKEQAIVNYLQYIVTDGWDVMNNGLEGIHYNKDENGNLIFTEAYNEFNTWRGIFKLVMPSADYDYWIGKTLSPEKKALIKGWLDTCIGNTVITLDAGFRPAAADLPEFIDYVTTVDETIAKIIIGDLPVEAWDDCLDGWYENGGELYVQQMNEYIASQNQ